MQWPLAMLTLVLVLAQFTWTMLTAMVVKATLLTVQKASLSTVFLATMRMLE